MALIFVVAVVAAGGLFASNMGFKLNYQLFDSSNAGSNSGTSVLALPFNRQTGVDMASSLQTDIGFAAVANIQKFDESSDGLTAYTGRKGSPPDFALSAGEANFIKMISSTDYIVVGSHDPAAAISLEDSSDPGSNSGTNFFAYPYHSTSVTALDLMNDIGFASVANVQNFDPSNDGLTAFTGRKGSPPDFNLNPGNGYFIKMISTVGYVPSHY
jgi:hypothetical protein